MIALRKNPTFKALRIACPEWDWVEEKGWFYCRFAMLASPFLYIHENVPLKSLIDKTLVAVKTFWTPERKLFFFHDGHGGWISFPRKFRAFQIEDLHEIEHLISKHIYFRNPFGYEDNYNIIDMSGQWMVTFSHEKEWLVFHRDRASVEELKARIDDEDHPVVWQRFPHNELIAPFLGGETAVKPETGSGKGNVSEHRDK